MGGCPWDDSACARAVDCRHMEVLKWLRSEGCPWNKETWASASSSLIREWLEEYGCPLHYGDDVDDDVDDDLDDDLDDDVDDNLDWDEGLATPYSPISPQVSPYSD